MSNECMDCPSVAKPVDVWIGRRVASIRGERGHSAAEIARILELSEEEYGLLEAGAVRIAAQQLLEISRALDCPLESFFQEMDRCAAVEVIEEQAELPDNVKSQLARLTRVFTMISKDEEREYLIRLAAGFAAQSETRERHH